MGFSISECSSIMSSFICVLEFAHYKKTKKVILLFLMHKTDPNNIPISACFMTLHNVLHLMDQFILFVA